MFSKRMDGALLFRLLLIVLAGFALVIIISSYSNSVLNEQGETPENKTKEGFYNEAEMAIPNHKPTVHSTSIPKAKPAPKSLPLPAGSQTAMKKSSSQHPVDSAAKHPNPSAVIAPSVLDSLKPEDLLPRLGNTPEEQRFVSVNPSVPGDFGAESFLNSGYWSGAITNTNKVANRQIRSDPIIVPQKVGPFLNTPYEMNTPNRPFEIGHVSSV